jgi:hypothetical protein
VDGFFFYKRAKPKDSALLHETKCNNPQTRSEVILVAAKKKKGKKKK